MYNTILRINEEFITNEGYKIKIIECFRWNNCTIQFEDTTLLYNIRYDHIKSGTIKNPNHPSVYNIGYIGIGNYCCKKNNILTKEYSIWQTMLGRCYSFKTKLKHPTYKDCTVVKEWHNFQNFAKWFKENYIDDYELDKDLLVRGNKVYGPDTCCFIPQEINTLLLKNDRSRGRYPLGVNMQYNKFRGETSLDGKHVYIGSYDTPEEAFYNYKLVKEAIIKSKAEYWKNKIKPEVYENLLIHTVEITD